MVPCGLYHSTTSATINKVLKEIKSRISEFASGLARFVFQIGASTVYAPIELKT